MTTPSLKILAIAAMDEGRVIGVDNRIPWHYPEDMKHFARLTTGHTVLMGRKTYQSLPSRFRPLPNRKNVVVTRNIQRLRDEQGIEVCDSPTGFLERCRQGLEDLPSEQVWIIGGEQIYQETLAYWDEVYLSIVHVKYQGDAHFVRFEDQFELVERQDQQNLSFLHYVRGPS